MGKQDFLANKARREAGEAPVAQQEEAIEVIDTELPTPLHAQMAATKNRVGNEPDVFKRKIKNQEDFDWLREVLLAIKGDWKLVDGARQKLTLPYRQAEAAINEQIKPYTTWCKDAEKDGKARMGEFVTEQKKKEQVAQAEAEEAARKAQAAIEKRADKAEAAGHVEKADELAEQASQVQVQDVTTDKQKGESTVWDYDEKDAREFIRHAAQDPYLINALKIDKTFVKKYLTQCNDNSLELPGLKIKTNVTFALR